VVCTERWGEAQQRDAPSDHRSRQTAGAPRLTAGFSGANRWSCVDHQRQIHGSRQRRVRRRLLEWGSPAGIQRWAGAPL